MTTLDRVPYLAEYFGLWSIEEIAGQQLADLGSRVDINSHLAGEEPLAAMARVQKPIIKNGDAGTVELFGPLMKHSSSLSGGTSTVDARRRVRALAEDPDVGSILLHIESPGGTVAGTKELGDEIAKAAQSKRVVAFIEDLGASAAYWLASQASEIYANETAQVGSIGTYLAVRDTSEAFEKAGVKTHVIRAGEFKGLGMPGTKLTEEHIAYLQNRIEEVNEFFLEAVADGRAKLNIDQVRELADGKTHSAKRATALGLIDGVKTFEEVQQLLRSGKGEAAIAAKEVAHLKGSSMSTEKTVATFDQLAAISGTGEETWICDQLKAGRSIEEARGDWNETLVDRIGARDEEIGSLKAEVENLKGELAGNAEANASDDDVEPFDAGAAEDIDEPVSVDELIAEKVKAGSTRGEAIRDIRKKSPELIAEWIGSHNAQHRA